MMRDTRVYNTCYSCHVERIEDEQQWIKILYILSPELLSPELHMRMLEDPDEEQADIMRAFGWKIAGGVLQEI